jgi:hypothetical protein
VMMRPCAGTGPKRAVPFPVEDESDWMALTGGGAIAPGPRPKL